MVKILVISMENENGEKRRSYLNYDYHRIIGCNGSDDEDPFVKEAKEKIKLRYNASQERIDGYSGNVASHLKALDYIIKNKLDKVIVNEDDSLQKLPIPENLPDEICLLSGQVQEPTNWSKSAKWKREGKNLEIISQFKEGVNDIDYSKYRWTQINSLYIPTHLHAEKLLGDLRNNVKSYKAYDLVLSENRLVKKIYYPAIFNHHDKLKKSQVAVNPGVIVDYVKIGSKADIDYPDYSSTQPKGTVS